MARDYSYMLGNRWAAGRTPPNKGKGSGTVTNKGYRRIRVGGRRLMEHRVVWEEANGPIPDGHLVHHKNDNKLDNRLGNLELLPWGEHTTKHNGSREYLTGWQHSEETKRKIAESNKKARAHE